MMSVSGSSVAIVFGLPSVPAAGATYRLGRPLAAIQFNPNGKGYIVFLPDKAELSVVGPSSLRNCSEIMYQKRLYSVFNVDVLGCWSTPVRSKRSNPVRPPQNAIAACA